MTTFAIKLCKKPTCQEPKAPDSVCCVFHRDQKKQANQDWRDRKNKGLPKRKPGRQPKGAAAAAVVQHELTRAMPAMTTAVKAATLSIEAAIDERRQAADKLQLEIAMLEGTLQMLQAPMVGAGR